jgi:hypothetical protein
MRAMLWREQAYERALRATRMLVRSGWSSAGLRTAVAGRRSALPHVQAWAASERRAVPLVLVHAPSVGDHRGSARVPA